MTSFLTKLCLLLSPVCGLLMGSSFVSIDGYIHYKPRKAEMLRQINQIRSEGCYCGRAFMPAVEPLVWNNTLAKSALSHAKDMERHDYFAHYNRRGESIGDRLDAHGYRWAVAGENLGEGQRTFDEVVKDWLESPSHCEMLMNPKVKEMGIARYGSMWVQHFGSKLPKDARRVGRRSRG